MAPRIKITQASHVTEELTGYKEQIEAWILSNSPFKLHGGPRNNDNVSLEFDQAVISAGFHRTASTGKRDRNPTPHLTIQLSNEELRDKQAWYTLHWHEEGESSVFPNPETVDGQKKTREARRKRKQNRREQGKPTPSGSSGGQPGSSRG